MAAHPCTTPIMQRATSYQVLNSQYSYPVQQHLHQQQKQPYLQKPPLNNPVFISVQNPTNSTILQQNETVNGPNLIGIPLRRVTPQNNLDRKLPVGNDIYLINNQLFTTGNSPIIIDLNSAQNITTGSNVVRDNIIGQNIQVPQTNKISVSIQASEENNKNKNDRQTGYVEPKPPEKEVKSAKEIPELTQVQVNPDQTEKIGSLKIELSGSFMSWNIAGKTILDLNFMRNVFCITNLDVIFELETPYESGLCEGLNRLIQNKLLSDWLVLKCEGKQIPFFKVNNLIQLHSANNFITLLSIIAEDSCLPLPFITKNGRREKYYYINFPKSISDRVRKLNVPIFHDADNGRKKISCKYPGIRLDCNFENAVQKFDIHVHASAAAAFEECLTSIRQVIIYKHIVWGFLQAWTRKVREQFNGCFKIQDIAQNLCLCLGNTPRSGIEFDQGNELIYYIDYSNFYLKFDPVGLKDTSFVFSIQNFETNYVCDISIIQYYRQFFLINDMHYSDALKNIVIFSEENGANKVTDFVYTQSKSNNDDKAKVGFSPPDGINRATMKNRLGKIPPTTLVTSTTDLNYTNPRTEQCIQQQSNVPSLSANVNKVNWNLNDNQSGSGKSEHVLKGQKGALPSKEISRPLIKARTVEEINSSVGLKDINPEISTVQVSKEGSKAQTESSNQKKECIKLKMNIQLSPYIREILCKCYAKNAMELTRKNMYNKSNTFQQIFNHAVSQAMEMSTVDDFLDKMYTTLQKFYTNSICQSIMDRTITRVLMMKFPSMKEQLIPKTPLSIPPEGVSSQKMRKIYDETPNIAKSSQSKQKKIDNSEKDIECISILSRTVSKSPKCKRQIEPESVKTTTCLDHTYTKNTSNEIETTNSQPITANHLNLETIPQSTVKVDLSPKETPISVQSVCEINNEINKKEKGFRELKKSIEKIKRNHKKDKNLGKDNENFAKGNITENNNSISINLTLPLSDTSNDVLIEEETLKIVSSDWSMNNDHNLGVSSEDRRQRQESSCDRWDHIVKQEENNYGIVETENESLKASLKEKELFEKFNLKHCIVLLNAEDVTNLLEKRNGEWKRRRTDTISMESITSDSNNVLENNPKDKVSVPRYSSCRKKSKEVSEFELLEAKTRVLQRLRKRNNMNIFGEKSQLLYTEEEFENFIRNSGNRSKSVLSVDSESSEEQDTKYQTLYQECLARKAKVVLSRLEDAKEENTKEIKWKVRTNADGSLTITKDRNAEYENIPRNKRKFFELKEGKLYLKEEYQVKNGEIVLANPNTIEKRINLKSESDLTPSIVKVETSPE